MTDLLSLAERVEQIVGSLTEAQRDALLGRFSWRNQWEQEEGEAELYRLGIWGPHGGNSPLGLAVRSHLQTKGDRNGI